MKHLSLLALLPSGATATVATGPYATPAAPDLAAYVLSHERYDAAENASVRAQGLQKRARRGCHDRRVRVPAWRNRQVDRAVRLSDCGGISRRTRRRRMA